MRANAQQRQQTSQRLAHAVGLWFLTVAKACFCPSVLREPKQDDVQADAQDPSQAQSESSYRKPFETLTALRGDPILAAKELLQVHFQMIIEKRTISPGALDEHERQARGIGRFGAWLQSPTNQPLNYYTKFGQLFTIPRIRRATGTAVVSMLSQQLCGVSQKGRYGTKNLTSCC